MVMSSLKTFCLLGATCLGAVGAARADEFTDPPAPTLALTNVPAGQKRVSATPYPSADVFKLQSVTNLGSAWADVTNAALSNLTWTVSSGASNQFFRLQTQPLSSNALLT